MKQVVDNEEVIKMVFLHRGIEASFALLFTLRGTFRSLRGTFSNRLLKK